MQKQRDLFLFYPFVYTNMMKMHLKTETSKNKDLNGDLENRARKTHENACVNRKMNTW